MSLVDESERTALSHSSIRRFQAVGFSSLVALATAVTLLRPLSFDEMYWVTVARRIFGAGDLPYFDLLDNKGPLLYGIFGLADLLPVPERGVLTVLFVTIVSALAIGVWRLAGLRGQSDGWRLFTAALSTLTMAILSVWAVTTELIASTFLVWAFVVQGPWVKLTTILVACLVDPRAVLFAPVVLFDARRSGQIDHRHITVFATLAAAAVTTVLSVPELRYAIVEASLSTRFDASMSDLVLVSAAALTPLLVLCTVRIHRIPRVALAVLVIALVIGISAGLPFGHYWVYVGLVAPLLPISRARVSGRTTALAALLSIIALTLATRDHFAHDVNQAEIQEPIAAWIEGSIGPDDRVLVWASSPHLRYRIAEQTLGFAPTSNYLAWGLPDTQSSLDRLAADIQAATVVVVDPGLDSYRGFPGVAGALDLIADATSRADCTSMLDEVTLYRFEGC